MFESEEERIAQARSDRVKAFNNLTAEDVSLIQNVIENSVLGMGLIGPDATHGIDFATGSRNFWKEVQPGNSGGFGS